MPLSPLRYVKVTGALCVIPKSECPLCDLAGQQKTIF